MVAVAVAVAVSVDIIIVVAAVVGTLLLRFAAAITAFAVAAFMASLHNFPGAIAGNHLL